MFQLGETLTASSSRQALEDRILIQEQQVSDMLAPYEAVSATLAWFDSLRAVDECINLVTVDWGDAAFEQELASLPVTALLENAGGLIRVRDRLRTRFSDNFANRFAKLMVQGASIALAFSMNGSGEVAAEFRTVGSMMGYLQSRRRHLVALLHMLPTACQGNRRVQPLDTMNIFLPIVELAGIQMVSAQNALNVKLARARLGLPETNSGGIAMLDSLFLEPERARITEMPLTEPGLAMLAARETPQPDRLFSAAELRNDILAIEASYAEFDLASTDFAPAAALVRRLSTDFVERDYWIAVTPENLSALFDDVGASPALRKALVHTEPGYMAALATYAPFVLLGGAYRSTVALLSRFAYQWRARSLDRRKRFQIRAGFIFEDAVAGELERQGFAVQGITRIDGREFDVVTIRNGIIWNVQCKNNFVDLGCVDSDAVRFARYNRGLVRSYERALDKERRREGLVKAKLSLDRIEHVVVSRFPVVTDNPRIVPFSRIGSFGAIADALLA